MREQFQGLVAKASKQFLSDQVNERIKVALGGPSYGGPSDNASVSGSEASERVAEASARNAIEGDGITTTLEELEAFQIVRAIACSEVKPMRIAQRDTKSYFGVLLDDNNRKPIARIHFNTGQKYIGLFDREKNETRHPIDALDEIYEFAGHIRETVHFYD